MLQSMRSQTDTIVRLNHNINHATITYCGAPWDPEIVSVLRRILGWKYESNYKADVQLSAVKNHREHWVMDDSFFSGKKGFLKEMTTKINTEFQEAQMCLPILGSNRSHNISRQFHPVIVL